MNTGIHQWRCHELNNVLKKLKQHPASLAPRGGGTLDLMEIKPADRPRAIPGVDVLVCPLVPFAAR